MESRAVLLLVGLTGCVADGSVSADRCEGSARPSTIDEMVDHLNTLPLPVDAPCLMRSLARPLRVAASSNPFSAQPAYDASNPRIFLFSDTLVISLVPKGSGSEVVEFGEQVAGLRTKKGELALPIDQPVDRSDPHEKIREGPSHSACSLCHLDEVYEPDGSWSSVGLGLDDRDVVGVSQLRDQAEDCSTSEDPQRCGFYAALFDGPVEAGSFPDGYPTIYEAF